MSANPKPDLEQIKSKFESFRAERNGKKQLPENLWAEAVSLLGHYPFSVVRRELRLKAEYLRMHAEKVKGKPVSSVQKKSKFLTLTGRDLITVGTSKNIAAASADKAAECRLTIERADGGRLTITMDGLSQIDWQRIEAMCSGFLRA
jgi:hypothetical protein